MGIASLLTTAEVAERFEVTVSTVNRWAAQGDLPVAHKFPGNRGARLYHPIDVEAFARRYARSEGSAA